MASFLDESDIERSLLEQFREIGYETAPGAEISPGGERPERRSYGDVVLRERLRTALVRINAHLPAGAVEEALRRVERSEVPGLVESNRRFHRMLADGVTVELQRPARAGGGVAYETVRLVDFEHPEDNDFLAVSQLRVTEGKKKRRLDVVVFVNGLPLAVFELKNPADEKATIKDAYAQLQTYKDEFPALFGFNEVLVATDGLEARAGTLTSDWDRFMPWRTVEGRDVAPASLPQLDVLVAGMFDKSRFLDLLQGFVVFEDDGRGAVKKMAAYHQYHAVRKAVEATVRAARGDRRIGVVWHTQGSGKSLSMVFYAGRIAREPAMKNPTLVVITDRNDLDDQLFGTFAVCHELLRQTPKKAESRDEMRELLNTTAAGGVIFTTIQKFMPDRKGDRHPRLSDRDNVVVIADEAHRSQYETVKGYAAHLRDALPRASFIGFTGTPIELGDKSTTAIFGHYIDTYDIEQSIEDGATVRIYYEARLAKIALKEDERPRIDPDFEEVTEAEEAEDKERLKSKWAQLEKLVGAPKRMALVAADLVAHFERRDAPLVGKGMIVGMSRRICVELYKEIVELRPDWHDEDDDKGAIKIVMTGSASDPRSWQEHIRSKAGREAIAKRFKAPSDPLKLVIVRDMWLTGFDVPSLHTMYVDKPMHGHTLMQAIARVNRVFRDKPGGLVVDYLGLADQLRQAVATYTASGGRGRATVNMEDAVLVLREKYGIVRDMLHGFDVEGALSGSIKQRQVAMALAADFVLGPEVGKERFLPAMSALSQAFALAGASDEAARIRDEVAFFQALRAAILKRSEAEGGRRSREDVEAAIRQIVSRSIVSEEVVDVFSAAGLEKPEISILSDQFLEDVRNLPYRNLAVELLERLLAGEIQRREKRNVVQARSFREMLEEAIRRYQNRSIETAQLILELIDMARQFREADRRGEKLGLTDDELAFYDALETSDSAVAVLGDAVLRTIARELTRTVRENVSIDWNERETARANLRRLVKRVLRRHGYPPEKREKAAETVLLQATTLGDQMAEEAETAPPPAPERPFRVVPREDLIPFENAVPVLDLAAAAGGYSPEQEVDGLQEAAAHPDRFEWAELPDYYRPRPGLFVARVEGESMNRVIPSGTWCLFRLSPEGTRDGKIVLVRHRQIQDTDHGGHYTVKRYRSEKEHLPDGTWRHTRIRLLPETDREGYEPIELQSEDAEDLRIVAEWIGPVEQD